MHRIQNTYMSIDQIQNHYFDCTNNVNIHENDNEISFHQVLDRIKNNNEMNQSVSFSKHANDRLASRNINLNQDQISRLNKGVMQAKQKSIKESLVIMDDIAFIVNIKNNTVVTAMDQHSNDSNIFTNIDGAVIV